MIGNTLRLPPWARGPAHSTLMPFQDVGNAQAGTREKSDFFLLNGAWKFLRVRRPSDRPAGFFSPDFVASAWKEFAVPGNRL
jgi:beta-galactosidase